MNDRKRNSLAIVAMVLTLVGLVTLCVLPVAVGIRLRYEFGRMDRLERARVAISDAIEAARRCDTFLMHRYVVPADTNGHYDPQREYAELVARWKAETSSDEEVRALDAASRAEWETGKANVSTWIESYLSQYATGGDTGGAEKYHMEEKTFRHGLAALMASREGAQAQVTTLNSDLHWLNTVQMTVVVPMAIVGFALAFIAWINFQTLRLSWVREREVRGHLEVAIQESNHRIKNNLQVIGALVDMKMQEPGDTVPKESLDDIVHQVRAVAAVHEFLSHELRSDQVHCDRMLQRLVELAATPIGLRVDLQAEAIALAVKQATAVALITNELLLNSGKHGATEVRVAITAADGTARLCVSDNGPGFPANFDAAQHANLGLALVDTLARHDLRGEVLYSNERGARVVVTFPLTEPTG